jgi:hypothetical protein
LISARGGGILSKQKMRQYQDQGQKQRQLQLQLPVPVNKQLVSKTANRLKPATKATYLRCGNITIINIAIIVLVV